MEKVNIFKTWPGRITPSTVTVHALNRDSSRLGQMGVTPVLENFARSHVTVTTVTCHGHDRAACGQKTWPTKMDAVISFLGVFGRFIAR